MLAGTHSPKNSHGEYFAGIQLNEASVMSSVMADAFFYRSNLRSWTQKFAFVGGGSQSSLRLEVARQRKKSLRISQSHHKNYLDLILVLYFLHQGMRKQVKRRKVTGHAPAQWIYNSLDGI